MAAEDAAPETLLTAITGAVRERIAPQCRHFGICGGCQLQDLSQSHQLDAKAEMLRQIVHHAGVPLRPAIEVHAAVPWEYRNRARFRTEGSALGYSRRASHDFLPISECPIVSPLIWRAAERLQALVREGKAAWPEGTSSVEVFANESDSALQLSFVSDATLDTLDRGAPRALRTLCDALREKLPALVGAGLSVRAAAQPGVRSRLRESFRVEIATWGEPALTYAVNGQLYRITRNAFFQVNRFLTGALVRAVLADHHGALAYDLFAGAGLLSVPLTARFDRVVAVEVAEPAASNLQEHLRSCGPSHRAVRSTVEDFLLAESRKGGPKPDLIVLDPPRAGLNLAGAKALPRASAGTIVYVSCNAASFARDSRHLVQSGYTLDSLHLFDLFPQTFHTETVAVFRR